jgi:type II secretory pathway pseudopilin PulG
VVGSGPSTPPEIEVLVVTFAIRSCSRRGGPRFAFTLVELLVAISITLLIMATVVQVFTSVSDSVQKRRSMVEVSNQLRHVRNQLQSDLNGATCPAIPWTRPESNHGYFEVIEGPYSDFNPSLLTDFRGTPGDPANPEINHATSTIPTSNLDYSGDTSKAGWVTDGRGLGDHDDVLAFTSRNESSPFLGRAPVVFDSNGNLRAFGEWDTQTIESPVAEIIWYCVESPSSDNVARGYFGEPGYRTVYRRVLLVAPWLNYNFPLAGTTKSRPGVLRILPSGVSLQRVELALASLIAFQERYDISARIEWDPTLDNGDGRWTIVANTLADLTKRENRYEHHGIVGSGATVARQFPFAMVSGGGAASPTNPTFVVDPEYGVSNAGGATVRVHSTGDNGVYNYQVTNPGSANIVRPLVVLPGGATARAILNEQGEVVHVTTGLAPLGVISGAQSRVGDDVMLSQAMAFDIQVFDPKAPIYAIYGNGRAMVAGDVQGQGLVRAASVDATPVAPGDAGWSIGVTGRGTPINTGAYVDLGYVFRHQRFVGSAFSLPGGANDPVNRSLFAFRMNPKSQLIDPARSLDFEATVFRTYDTWSFHYETNGIDEDRVFDDPNSPALIDEGTNGFDDYSWYDLNGDRVFQLGTEYVKMFGVDDMGERETSPPYPVPLRGVQVKLRVYESDSRQMREVTVRQNFVSQ